MNDPPESGLQPKPPLLDELRGMIQSTRERVARTVNRELVLLYWTIGRRIRQDVLGTERGKYGEEIVSTVSRQLSAEFGSGFSPQNIFHMLRFAEVWPDEEPVAALAERLSWSHLKEILYLKNDLQRPVCSQHALRQRKMVGLALLNWTYIRNNRDFILDGAQLPPNTIADSAP
jgi:hypothetical protein